MMTYKELLNILSSMTQEELNSNVTIYDCVDDEYIPVNDLTFTVGTDVLDDNHPILLINEVTE